MIEKLNMQDEDKLIIAEQKFDSRIFVGTGKYGSIEDMLAAVQSARPSLVTVALKRFDLAHPDEDIYSALQNVEGITIMPNTSGAKNAEEAYQAAHIGRELSGSSFVKVEIHPDNYHLMPDPIETYEACQRLVADNFIVLPYIQPDPILARRLQDVGVAAVMPLGSVIGSGQGLVAQEFIKIILHQANVPVVVDAGLRSPSDAARAMELGVGAVLVNTALALAQDPGRMGEAFRLAVKAGRLAYRSGIMDQSSFARASSLTSFLGQS